MIKDLVKWMLIINIFDLTIPTNPFKYYFDLIIPTNFLPFYPYG